ncbi:hypothetical protein BGX24_000614 [Mortierella sp. AD032]|nr:hypothetical protein BGX24_000614 [Mortierella sp. AD032]
MGFLQFYENDKYLSFNINCDKYNNFCSRTQHQAIYFIQYIGAANRHGNTLNEGIIIPMLDFGPTDSYLPDLT